jgi:hypothetical protein
MHINAVATVLASARCGVPAIVDNLTDAAARRDARDIASSRIRPGRRAGIECSEWFTSVRTVLGLLDC